MQKTSPSRGDRRPLRSCALSRSAWLDGFWWINSYVVVALGLIVVYYVLVLNLTLFAGRTAGSVALEVWSTGGMSLWQGSCFLLGLAVLAGLLPHLLAGIMELVTAKYDPVDDIDPILLAREDYGELYRLIGDVAHSLAAPLPDTVRVTHLAQCYVVEERHFGIRPRRRLILVLGLPHLKVLSQTELRVVVAHELAHFRCRDTMLRVFFCRFLESLRIAIERMEKQWLHWMNPLYLFCKAYRQIALLVSARVCRWQELRADRLSARVYGGQLSVATLLKEWMVTSQFALAVAEYERLIREASATPQENIFEMFSQRWREFSSAGRNYLQQRLTEEERPSTWDSHPTTQQRINVMSRIPDNGFQSMTPAWNLVRNLAAVEDELHERVFQEG